MTADGGRNDDIHRIKREVIACEAVNYSDIHHK